MPAKILATLLLVLALPASALADPPHELIARAMTAMGGKTRLEAIRSVRYTAVGYRNMLEQSVRPSGPYLMDYETLHVTRDYAAHRSRTTEEHLAFGSAAAWTQETQPDSRTYVIDDDVAAIADGTNFRYAGGYYLAFDREQYAFSPERVLLTADQARDLRLLPDVKLHGFTHHVLAYSASGASCKLFLNAYTNLPTAVEFVRAYPYNTFLSAWGDVPSRITYEGWTLEPGGIRYPRQWSYERLHLPDTTLFLTQLQFNPAVDGATLSIPTQLYAQHHGHIAPLDRLALGAGGSGPVEIAPGVVQYPGAWNVEFVKQDDGVVAIEAPISPQYAQQAFDFARRHFGLPVKAVVTTSDSWPHIAGIRQAVANGIPVYALDLNLPILHRMIAAPHTLRPDDLQRAPRKPVFVAVTKTVRIGSGANQIELVPYREETAERQMMVYLPNRRLLYTSDLFSPLGDNRWFTPEYVREALDAIGREGLDPVTIFGMHYGPTPFAALRT